MKYISFIVLCAFLFTSALLAQNNFVVTGDMNTAQVFYQQSAMVSLNDGKVLLIGGYGNGAVLSSCQMYNPSTGTWIPAASMLTARHVAAAAVLPDGRVLVAGGMGQSSEVFSSVEVYDPSTDSWSYASSLSAPRAVHIAIRLKNGRILVAGGTGPNYSEIYDPVSDNWTPSGPVNISRNMEGLQAALLSDGKVLIAGGATTTTCEIFDPSTGSWTVTGSMIGSRNYAFNLIPLKNGKILAAGGQENYSANVTAQAELYDPSIGTWAAITPLPEPRHGYCASLLLDGKVLIAGGATDQTVESINNLAFLFDPSNQTWSPTSGTLAFARYMSECSMLPDGRILIAGGMDASKNLLASAELYIPITTTTTPKDNAITSIKNANIQFSTLPILTFKNSNMASGISQKLNAILFKIDQGYYQGAYNQLVNDVLKKVDGCANSGQPDKDDWLNSCESQTQVYQIIVQAINNLADMR
jgi:N-acetylneuraminic acid mutarotase